MNRVARINSSINSRSARAAADNVTGKKRAWSKRDREIRGRGKSKEEGRKFTGGDERECCPAGAESCRCSVLCYFCAPSIFSISTLQFPVLVLSFFCSSTVWLLFISHIFSHSLFNEQSMALASVLSLMWSVQNETAGE